MEGVFVFLAEGFEEIEALATVDLLRRGGVDVRTVSISDEHVVTGVHGIPVVADLCREQLVSLSNHRSSAMIFPGGLPGAKYLAEDRDLIELMKEHYAAGGIVAAICAAPGLVVSQLPSLEGKRFTCYHGFEDTLIAKGALHDDVPAVADGNLITGRGPGCAVEFGLTVLEALKGKETADRVRAGLLI